jgi:16S rRNA processing protein RimM
LRLSNEPERGQASITEEESVIIGRVVSVNVPRCELRIASETSHPERFRLLSQLRLKTKQEQNLVLPVKSVRVTKKQAIITINGKDADTIAATRGADVVVPRSERFQLPPNEYYIDDIVGLVVKDTGGRDIGRIKEVWHTPANDIYQVLDEDGKETLLPAIEEIIIDIDVERGELTADISLLE